MSPVTSRVNPRRLSHSECHQIDYRRRPPHVPAPEPVSLSLW